MAVVRIGYDRWGDNRVIYDSECYETTWRETTVYLQGTFALKRADNALIGRNYSQLSIDSYSNHESSRDWEELHDRLRLRQRQ